MEPALRHGNNTVYDARVRPGMKSSFNLSVINTSNICVNVNHSRNIRMLRDDTIFTNSSLCTVTNTDINGNLKSKKFIKINNNNNNNHDDIYSAVIYGASHMREFTVVHLGQSWSAPGGRQLVGQAANLTFESACRLL